METIKEAGKKSDRKRKQFFNDNMFAVGALSEREQQELMDLYDVSIEQITPLVPSQQWLFAEQNMVSPQFYLQSLFKLKGIIAPQALMDRANRLIKEHTILRTAFYFGETRTLAVVLRGRSAEFTFRDLGNITSKAVDETLERILEADRRRGFSLETDRLLRVGVYKTGHREYAVMVAQPQVVADGWAISELFNTIFLTEDAVIAANGREDIRFLRPTNLSFSSYLQQRSVQDKAPALRYWKNLLTGLPDAPELPGHQRSILPYEQMVDTVEIEHDVLQKCYAVLTGGKTRLATVLQTAWGLMLQSFNQTEDTYFCAILSNRSACLETMEESAGILNIMPVRVDCRAVVRVADILKKQYMQSLVSEPMSYCDRNDLLALSGKKGEFFSHFLNFHSFFSSHHAYSAIDHAFGIVPVTVNSFDYQIADLGVYFRMNGEKLMIEFVYNHHCFPKDRIFFLRNSFLFALNVMLENIDESVDVVKQQLQKLYLTGQVNVHADYSNYGESAHFLEQLTLFEGLHGAELERLAACSQLRHCLENDVLFAEGQKQEFIYIIMQGQVEISRCMANGWQGSLGILREKCVINIAGVVDLSSAMRAETISKSSVILAIPREAICTLLETRKSLLYGWLRKMAAEIERYQKLWASE